MTTVPLSDLTATQRRRTRCFEVANLLLAGHTPEIKMRVALWLYNGHWGDDA